MELNVWLDTTVTKVERGDDDKGWTAYVKGSDGFSRTLHPRHVIFANGFGGGRPNMPSFHDQVCLRRLPVSAGSFFSRAYSKVRFCTHHSTRVHGTMSEREW